MRPTHELPRISEHAYLMEFVFICDRSIVRHL